MSIFNEETLENAVISVADLTGLTASLVWQGYCGDLSGLFDNADMIYP